MKVDTNVRVFSESDFVLNRTRKTDVLICLNLEREKDFGNFSI